MQKLNIRSKCRINSNFEEDTFVGLKCENGDLRINFPLGFRISDDDKELRKDIIMLFECLKQNTDRKDSQILGQVTCYDIVDFPLQSYIYLIRDFYARGYYKEREVIYTMEKSGKINWNRTIKMKKPYVQDNNVFYLDFITKKNSIKENEMITLIHEYCVYESFNMMGWLFSNYMPQKPRIKKAKNRFKTVIKQKLSSTFNDKNRMLFQNMLAILNYQGDNEANKNYCYGTYRFEYVWEKMIDKVFGIKDKKTYFPKTTWRLNLNTYDNASLEPDTIMIYNNNIYVLDAKYYKYGVSPNPMFLPKSTSINKQITYGEYIANEKEFRKIHGENMKVYNAFLMPFNMEEWKGIEKCSMLSIGEAISNWKDNDLEYQHIKGILIDVKILMSISTREDKNEIKKLVKIIEEK